MGGTTVWITGASSGIGAALARAWAKAGARLILSARRVDRLHAVRGACGLDEARCLVLPLDLAKTDALPVHAERAWSHFDGIDILVNNGGVSQRSLALETAQEVTETILRVNFMAAVTLTTAIVPRMIERGGGRVVVVSSIMGKFGAPKRSSYCASKHALHGYFDALRAETARQGLGVTLVCPGYIQTEISTHAYAADGSEHGKMDPGQAKGMSADDCAARILKAVARGTDELSIGGKETWGVMAKRFVPGLLNRIMRSVDPD